MEKYTLKRNGEVIDLKGEVKSVEICPVFGCEVAVHFSKEHGHILFLDGEAQISEHDYITYHAAMLSLVPYTALDILVIGDGDGGISHFAEDYNITQVEPSSTTRKVAAEYFGANWEGVDLREQTLRQYLETEDKKYDAILLAITDEFNTASENVADVVKLFNTRLKEGGVMVCQVGCESDPELPSYLRNYSALEDIIGGNYIESTPYIPCFRSKHIFRAYTKTSMKRF